MVFFLLAAFALPLYIIINPVAVFPTSGHFFLVTFGYNYIFTWRIKL